MDLEVRLELSRLLEENRYLGFNHVYVDVLTSTTQVAVYRKPVVALLSTGNELIDLHQEPSPSNDTERWTGVVDSNRPSLQAALEGLGYKVVDIGIAHDG